VVDASSGLIEHLEVNIMMCYRFVCENNSFVHVFVKKDYFVCEKKNSFVDIFMVKEYFVCL
jgi:hypothetical protein